MYLLWTKERPGLIESHFWKTIEVYGIEGCDIPRTENIYTDGSLFHNTNYFDNKIQDNDFHCLANVSPENAVFWSAC